MVLAKYLLELTPTDFQQLAVVDRARRCRTGASRQQRELTDHGPALERADHLRHGAWRDDLDPARCDEERTVRLLALVKQPLAGPQPHPPRPRGESLGAAWGQRLEQPR